MAVEVLERNFCHFALSATYLKLDHSKVLPAELAQASQAHRGTTDKLQ